MQLDDDHSGSPEQEYQSPIHAPHVDPETIKGDIQHGALHQFVTETYKSVELDGNEIIQTPDGQFLEYNLMEEDYFVENWLAQFAIGNVGGRSYFDNNGWAEMTQQFTKGIIVVDKEGDPVLVIPKFAQANLPSDAKDVLDRIAREAGVAQLVPDEGEKSRIINRFAEQTKFIGETANKHVAVTLTDMIPAEFYKRFGVNPTVMKQVIFIRDKYRVSDEEIEGIETILKRWDEEKIVSLKDRQYITGLTKGEFIFDESDHMVEPVVDRQNDEVDEEPFDPFAS